MCSWSLGSVVQGACQHSHSFLFSLVPHPAPSHAFSSSASSAEEEEMPSDQGTSASTKRTSLSRGISVTSNLEERHLITESKSYPDEDKDEESLEKLMFQSNRALRQGAVLSRGMFNLWIASYIQKDTLGLPQWLPTHHAYPLVTHLLTL